MTLHFYKYEGTGNDFVIIDDREELFQFGQSAIEKICDRKYGIGADGLILLRNDSEVHFKMVYFNSDGNESSMCGNGGRCITHLAHYAGMTGQTARFRAIDGIHQGQIEEDNIINLSMQGVNHIEVLNDIYILDTGSPHYVKFVENTNDIDLIDYGRSIRNSPPYNEKGINVNVVEKLDMDTIFVRTYERGVEDETLSCGTGVVAAALCHHLNSKDKTATNYKVHTKGGNLEVAFIPTDNSSFKEIWLKGPVSMVYSGDISL